MKKVFLTVVLVLAIAINYGFAQTGGGMMGQEGTKGHMQKMKEQKGMMTPEQTQKEMKGMTDQMSEMMREMAGEDERHGDGGDEGHVEVDAGYVQADAGYVNGYGKGLGQNT